MRIKWVICSVNPNWPAESNRVIVERSFCTEGQLPMKGDDVTLSDYRDPKGFASTTEYSVVHVQHCLSQSRSPLSMVREHGSKDVLENLAAFEKAVGGTADKFDSVSDTIDYTIHEAEVELLPICGRR